MKVRFVFPIWFPGWLLAVVGGGSLAFGADFAVSTASNAAFAEHLAQLNRKVPEGFIVMVQPFLPSQIIFRRQASGTPEFPPHLRQRLAC